MIDYQSFLCPKCGRAVLRTQDINYCGYCGARLPELKEPPQITCPMCRGTGKITQQPFNPQMAPHWAYFDNAGHKD